MNRISKATSVACLLAASFGAGCRAEQEAEIPTLDTAALSTDTSISPAELVILPVVLTAVNEVRGEEVVRNVSDYPSSRLLDHYYVPPPAFERYSFGFDFEGRQYDLTAKLTEGEGCLVTLSDWRAGEEASGEIDDVVAREIYNVLKGKYDNHMLLQRQAEDSLRHERHSQIDSLNDALQGAFSRGDDPFAALPEMDWDVGRSGRVTTYSGRHGEIEFVIVSSESAIDFGAPIITYNASIHFAGNEPFQHPYSKRGPTCYEFGDTGEAQWGLKKIVDRLDRSVQ